MEKKETLFKNINLISKVCSFLDIEDFNNVSLLNLECLDAHRNYCKETWKNIGEKLIDLDEITTVNQCKAIYIARGIDFLKDFIIIFREEIIDYLVEKNFNFAYRRDNSWETHLERLILSENLDLVKYAVSKGINFDVIMDDPTYRPITFPYQGYNKPDYEVTEYLLSIGVPLYNEIDDESDAENIIGYLINRNDYETFKKFVKYMPENQKFPWNFYYEMFSDSICKEFLDDIRTRYLKSKNFEGTPLILSILNNDFEEFQRIINESDDVEDDHFEYEYHNAYDYGNDNCLAKYAYQIAFLYGDERFIKMFSEYHKKDRKYKYKCGEYYIYDPEFSSALKYSVFDFLNGGDFEITGEDFFSL